MAQLLFFEFPSTGPFGAAAETAYADLAADIADEKGLIWKVWTEAPERSVAGGVYLFEDAESAAVYADKHTERLAGFGITQITARSYEVNDKLSLTDHAVLTR